MEPTFLTLNTPAAWRSLNRAAGTAALLAGLVFPRNLGVEIALFSILRQPYSVDGWYSLIQSNRLLG